MQMAKSLTKPALSDAKSCLFLSNRDLRIKLSSLSLKYTKVETWLTLLKCLNHQHALSEKCEILVRISFVIGAADYLGYNTL